MTGAEVVATGAVGRGRAIGRCAGGRGGAGGILAGVDAGPGFAVGSDDSMGGSGAALALTTRAVGVTVPVGDLRFVGAIGGGCCVGREGGWIGGERNGTDSTLRLNPALISASCSDPIVSCTPPPPSCSSPVLLIARRFVGRASSNSYSCS